MKKFMFLVISLSLFSAISFSQAAQSQQCTLEQTISFNTAVFLADFDYGYTVGSAAQNPNPLYVAQVTIQAFNTYKARTLDAANALPHPCLLELVAAENHVEQCQGPLTTATARIQQAERSAAQDYAQTQNGEAFEATIRGLMREMLQPPLPRACWFQPVSLPGETAQAYCSQAWSEYSQCYQGNQSAISTGRGSLSVCYRPVCVPGTVQNNGSCPNLWSAFRQCQNDFQRCTVVTHGRGPCPYCRRPDCPE